jgi:heptosyltransferase-1
MKVLIVRTGAMGDVLHALPAVAALRHARPDWQIDWVVDPHWTPLLIDADGHGPIVRRVHLAETKLWSHSPASVKTLRSILDLRVALRREHYDIAVDMQGTLRSGVIGWMAGAKRLAGFSDPREALAARFYSHRFARTGTHVVEQGAVLLGNACGIPLEPRAVSLPRDVRAEAWAEVWAAQNLLSRPLLMLAPGAGWGAKRWPPDRFADVARAIRFDVRDCVVNASSEGDTLAARVAAASDEAARVAVCSVAQLIALLRRTDIFLGGDSGPLHLAAALAVPLVALFGPTDPARNGPWGPGAKITLRDPASVTSYKRRAEPDPGLANIPVQPVVEALRSLI